MVKLLTVSVDPTQISDLKARLVKKPGQIMDAVAGAINDTAKHAEVFANQQIRKRLNVKKDVVDKVISRTWATPKKPQAVVTVSETARIALKDFDARQTNKGVTYRIEKGGPRKRISDAFGPDIPRLGGNVFRRVGKSRLPIKKLFGPSPWGVYVKAGMPRLTKEESDRFLQNRLDHRLQYQQPSNA